MEDMVISGKAFVSPGAALKRGKYAPLIVVTAPSGSGKSTVIYNMINQKLLPYLRIGIGNKSYTTIIACEFCLDERIREDGLFSICLHKKHYDYSDIFNRIIKNTLEVFAQNDYDVDETFESICGSDGQEMDKGFLGKILDPAGGSYHLGEIRDSLDIGGLKDALRNLLDTLDSLGFEERTRQKKLEMKNLKPKLSDIREVVFNQIVEEQSGNNELNGRIIIWLEEIEKIILRKLKDALGEEVVNGQIAEFDIDDEAGRNVVKELFNPTSPYGLCIDYISFACRPREQLISLYRQKAGNNGGRSEIPLRFKLRDTMGINQLGEDGLDPDRIKGSLEIALNCKADAVLYLMSLEQDEVTLEICSKALREKKKELEKRGTCPALYIFFTKADRIFENIISNKSGGELIIDKNVINEKKDEVLIEIENMVGKYSDEILVNRTRKKANWGSLRYVAGSLMDALEDEHFTPEGFFDWMVDLVADTVKSILPGYDPIVVTAEEDADPDVPVFGVTLDKGCMHKCLAVIQDQLIHNKEIVGGYLIKETTPRSVIHGNSVIAYWNKLRKGLGHSTKAQVFGYFSINMKGLIRRVLNLRTDLKSGSSDTGDLLVRNALLEAVSFSCDALSDGELGRAVQLMTGIKYEAHADGTREFYLQKLKEFFTGTMMEFRYSLMVDRVAYAVSYSNPDVRERLENVFYSTLYSCGYDWAIRELQKEFYKYFGDPMFSEVVISEFENSISEMINKMIIVI